MTTQRPASTLARPDRPEQVSNAVAQRDQPAPMSFAAARDKVFRQWDDGENIEQAISLTTGGPAPKWRRMDRVELAAFAKGGVSKKIEAWLLGPTQALWDGSPVVPVPEPEPHVCTGCIGDGPCEAEHEEPSVSADNVDADADEDRQEGERVR